MTVATLYELYLKRAKRVLEKRSIRKDDEATDSSSSIETTYAFRSSVPNKNDLPIGIVIPHGMNNNNSDENLADVSINIAKKESVWCRLLLSFSVITNFNVICDRKVGSDTVPCIHGLRAISMAWVILGNYYTTKPLLKSCYTMRSFISSYVKVTHVLLSSNMPITWSCAKWLRKSFGSKPFPMAHSVWILSSSLGKLNWFR